MELGVLGPLSVQSINVMPANGAPSAPKLRSVLATLLVYADQVVPVPSLMRELWGENPPNSGLTTLQTYILGLRKLLAKVAGRGPAEISGDVLVTQAGGYVFRTCNSALDLHRYHALVAAGRRSLAEGDDETGVRHLGAALGLWRGPALVDVTIGRVLESKRRQFEESRRVVLEFLVDAQLRLGMYREVLAELAALTVENPHQEGMHAQYMRALHLSGRRAQALEVFHRLRGNLVAELGIEPGPGVCRLHEAILNSEADIDTYLPIQRPRGEIVRAAAWGSDRVY
jgi:SARP family transcriptional regulator, regulator of embCAB operon